MNSLIVLALLVCTFATGHAITCKVCTEYASDDPNFQPPADPNAQTCSSNPGEMECTSDISSCMAMTVHMHFTRDVGPLTLSQESRSCGAPPGSGLPSGDACVAEQTIIDAFTSVLPNPSALFPPELGLTYQSLDATICLCDSADLCTPPSPGASEPAAGDGNAAPGDGNAAAGDGNVDSTMKPTTPSGAASLVSSMALLVGSLIHVFLCRVV